MRTTPFYRDTRVLAILAQIAFVVALVLVALFLYINVRQGLAATGRTFGWNFLSQTAGFEIAEGPVFLPSDTYRRAFVVGAINTVRVAGVGIILATLLGLLIGIARLSNNFLLRTLATIYVEVIRNTPALVQLFFWYFAVILALPDVKNHLSLPGLAIISNRGLVFTWPFLTTAGSTLRGWLVAALLVALAVGYLRQRRLRAQGKLTINFAWPFGSFVLIMLIGFAITWTTGRLPASISYELRRGDRGTLYVDVDANGQFNNGVDQPMRYVPVTLLDKSGKVLGETNTDREGAFLFFGLGEQKGASLTWQKPAPILVSQPEMQGFNVRGGLLITPEYAGVLLGLVIYTAAFIAEIVRAGINAVPKGQWEASRALGLTTGDTLRMIVLPQALRIAIPPLTSQFLNLTKNSSLALAVGYPDLFSVAQTILNQSGAELQVFLVLMATYLGFSLLTSAFTNWYNRRVALVER
jgi:general L-amino acid transport system permease protein